MNPDFVLSMTKNTSNVVKDVPFSYCSVGFKAANTAILPMAKVRYHRVNQDKFKKNFETTADSLTI